MIDRYNRPDDRAYAAKLLRRAHRLQNSKPNQGKGSNTVKNETTTTATPTAAQVNNAAKKAAKAAKKAGVTPAPAQGTNLGAKVTPQVPATPAQATPAATTTTKKEPFGGKKAEPFKTLGERDAFGFGQDTETSYLLAQLMEGKQTKEQLLASFLAKFVPDANVAESKRKKTSFSVFFSDVRKPFGTYHASRSLEIVADDTGVLSLEPKSVQRCQAAIKAKVLDDLRGLTPRKHREKINVVLKKHNLPLLADAK